MTIKKFDTIVIGGGHNGLTTAASLAKSGKSVCVIEKRSVFGGLAGSRKFGDQGQYRNAGVLQDTSQLRPRIVRDLELEKMGLQFSRKPDPVFLPAVSGPGILLQHDIAATEKEISHYSKKDAEVYRHWRAFIGRIRPVVEMIMDDKAMEIYELQRFKSLAAMATKALRLRLLGKADMFDLMRIAPMCVADWLNEWFESDLLKGGLAGPAVFGNYTGPWSPGTNFTYLIYDCMARVSVKGGPAALVAALLKSCEHHKVTMLSDTEVTGLLWENGRVSGVKTATGQTLSAQAVVATCDPKASFLGLVGEVNLGMAFAERIRNWRARGVTALVQLALDRPLEFACRPGFFPEHARIAGSLDDLERSFDPIKYGEIAKTPALSIHAASVADASLAPQGRHVVSILFHYAPFALRKGWDEAAKQTVLNATITTLSKYAPGIDQQVVASDVVSPVDMANDYGLSEGNLYHGEHAIDQFLVRPTVETMQYRTPVPGFYVGGSGVFPGGGISCAPGHLAAQVVASEI